MATNGNAKTVLLAKDEWPVLDFVLTLLQKKGYKVIVAVDGLEALQKAREHSGEIHLLLSDIQMPHVMAIELATQLLVEKPEMEVLLCNAQALDGLRVRGARGMACDGFRLAKAGVAREV